MSKVKFTTLAMFSVSAIFAQCEYSDSYIREQERMEQVFESYQQDIDDYIYEKNCSPEYDTQITEEEGVVTFTLVPRMTGDQREYLFHKIEQLTKEGMILMSDANRISSQVVEPDVRAALMAIISDAVMTCQGGAFTCYTACGYCLAELAYHYFYKYPEWQRCKRIVTEAQEKFHQAMLLEEKLWFDDNAEDWM